MGGLNLDLFCFCFNSRRRTKIRPQVFFFRGGTPLEIILGVVRFTFVKYGTVGRDIVHPHSRFYEKFELYQVFLHFSKIGISIISTENILLFLQKIIKTVFTCGFLQFGDFLFISPPYSVIFQNMSLSSYIPIHN